MFSRGGKFKRLAKLSNLKEHRYNPATTESNDMESYHTIYSHMRCIWYII